MKTSKYCKVLIIILFLGYLYLPLSQQVFNVFDLTKFELQEKRTLAKFPSFAKTNLLQWPKKFDRYYQDNFGLRALLIKSGNTIRYFLFEVSPSRSVSVGKQGWLYYGRRPQREFAQGKSRFAEHEIRTLKTEFRQRAKYLAQRGINYLVVIFPSKATTYPEYYNPQYPIRTKQNRIDHFLSSISPKESFPIVYIRDSIKKAKQYHDVPLYIATDPHWNDLGAYYGYAQLIKHLKIYYPKLSPIPLDSYRIEKRKFNGGFANLLGIFNQPHSFMPALIPLQNDLALQAARKQRRTNKLKRNPPLIVDRKDFGAIFTETNPEIEHAIVYRNSFFTRVTKFFSQHFKKSEYYASKSWKIDLKMIEKNQPSLVIEQFTDKEFNVPRQLLFAGEQTNF